jgi:peptidase C25-like protein
LRTSIISVFVLFLCISLTAFQINLENDEITIDELSEYSRIITGSDPMFSTQPGSPAIPLKTYYFKVPAEQQVENVTVTPQNSYFIDLRKQLLPIQAPVPLSADGDIQFTEPQRDIYEGSRYPQNLYYNYDEGKCGNAAIGFVTFYTSVYYPLELSLEVPRSFLIEIELTSTESSNRLSSGKVSQEIIRYLDLETDLRGEENDAYLLISTAEFMPAYQNLLNWRTQQGISVYSITIEDIETQFLGRDLQEKIRNCIIQYYENEQISYVTLGGDVGFIPDRKVFAFDCEFGAYDDENDIPSDMYYSCLHGSWDNNNNNIFGEDSDEVDYFPEVYVGRIPVNSVAEIEDYVDRLISYETGEISEYNKAAGFSMALWAGSDSEVCQQYIYDMYFPDNYNIEFFFGDENNQDNAYNIMNENQNIIQHTGHAGKTSMSLESGRIRIDDIDSLHNLWGGIFYSIGCWSAAIDYNSIGENLVSQIDRGFLGYIGNSRYGWGAPSASGFGFSEFYQKTFFRDLFSGHTNLAEVNAMQKIEFIPYFSGTSVYKWVAYQLNALGDSYFRINIDNPVELEYTSNNDNGDIALSISSAEIPVEGVSVSCGLFQVRSDIYGSAVIPEEYCTEAITLYKSGYRTEVIEPENYFSDLYLDFDELPEQLLLTQSEEITLFPVLYNNLPVDVGFEIQFDHNPEETYLSYEMSTGLIVENSVQELLPLQLGIRPVDIAGQMANGRKLYLSMNIISAETGEILTQRSLELTIEAPSIAISEISYQAEEILAGDEVQLEFSLLNDGSFPITGLELEFESLFPAEFEIAEYQIDTFLAVGDTVKLTNVLLIDDDVPSDQTGFIEIQISFEYNDVIYVFNKIAAINTGKISFSDDFENSEFWLMDPEWQIVDNYYFSQFNSFSCRPQYVGSYRADSPILTYLPGMELSFYYKYKMPMYGNDGVYVILESESVSETLIFLGAGGALPGDTRTTETYIESDWSQYNMVLEEIMIDPLLPGAQFSIGLLFTFPNLIEGFNEYADMEEVGVFFDDMKIGIPSSGTGEEYERQFQIYPNPGRPGDLPKFTFNSNNRNKCKLKIYDIRGRLINQRNYDRLGSGTITLYWDGKDRWGRPAASGIYIILIDTDAEQYRGKFVFIR